MVNIYIVISVHVYMQASNSQKVFLIMYHFDHPHNKFKLIIRTKSKFACLLHTTYDICLQNCDPSFCLSADNKDDQVE